ncbi:S-layer homology domain-containing protein [Paenibacillus thalictri]|uniref:S-layer homology domain-containing protein n=1 Tax=Paenibacillus thalictri TaxID=2527873 RepID=A0A4Q9DZF0_9BACL|nr:S-layer homology domain-containing protein [Paenibacillus thalictri]TBL81816.1 S-layer homology domain-containing protein [Paenibacillus thalictri]
MKKYTWTKKAIVSSLALTMAFGGTSAAFAKDKDHDDKGKGKNEKEYNIKGNNYTNFNNNNYYNTNNNSNNGKASLEIKLTFDDLKGKDVEWAIRYIASLASKRVFEGYEDGSFKPRQTITRIEAITAAVRLMGLRDQAESQAEMNSQLNFKDADKVKSKYPWAVGYVAVALENDLFTETEDSVQPEKEADRLWATTLLVKALKLQDEAKAKMGTKLTFKDANKIPAGSVGYVAEAIDKKLVDGYEDNTFRPSQPVTRAELAALLDRTGSQLPGNGSTTSYTLTGTVGSNNNNVISINQNGTAQQLTVDADAFVYRKGTKVSAAEIKAGDEIRANLYNGKVVFVEVTKAVDDVQVVNYTVIGTLNSYTLNASGQIATVSVNQTINGAVQTAVYNVAAGVAINDASLLTAGRSVQLQITNQQVTAITAQ